MSDDIARMTEALNSPEFHRYAASHGHEYRDVVGVPMTPAPTSQPAHDHGAAGFCTDHGQPADRPTTVAEATPRIRARAAEAIIDHLLTAQCAEDEDCTVCDGCGLQLDGSGDITREHARHIASLALTETLDALVARDAEIERLRASADAWWSEYDHELKAHEATKVDLAAARAEVGAIRDAFGVLIDMAEMDADGFRTVLTPADLRAVLDAFEAAAPGETVRAERCTDPKPWCPTETHGHVGGYITPWFRPDAPAGVTVTREAVEATWAAWFPSTSGPWSTNFRWRLYKALADLGLTVTDTPTEGGRGLRPLLRERYDAVLDSGPPAPAVGRRCGWCGDPHHDPGDCTVAQQAEAQRLCDADRRYEDEGGKPR